MDGVMRVINVAHGNLLLADADALVNTVNTSGVMGKGIALQFKRAYPEMFKAYERDAKAGRVELGRMHVWPTGQMTGPRYIINFPTKGHWKSRSRLGDVERGLADLVRVIRELDVTSIAVPPLGCGNGGLDWAVVEPRIRSALEPLSDVDVLLYPPDGAPEAAAMPNREPAPSMTPGRAALLTLLGGYAELALAGPSLIEAQKLMYFLQEAGEPLRLRYTKYIYGPYADNLRHVLKLVEGHYLSGFGDGSAPVAEAEPLRLLPGAEEAAEAVLDAHPETRRRIDEVLSLVDGFETSYGLELLASVHWVSREDPAAAVDPDRAVREVQSWTTRKGNMFTQEHIRRAWDVLRDRGWIRIPSPA